MTHVKVDLERVRQRLQQIKNSTTKQTNLYKPKPGKTQIRILPYKFQPGYPFIELFFHFDLGKRPILSPVTFGEPDPCVEYAEKLKITDTIYVGNLSSFTQEGQLIEYFRRCGEIRNLIMGLNKKKKIPCGFCFVQFNSHAEAALAINCMNLSMLDGKQIRIDWDVGFKKGRQFGRGRTTGGQVRDEVKTEEKFKQVGSDE